MWKLFIDDEREPIESTWIVARSSKQAIDSCLHLGLPSEIAFDHDLGGDDTARVFLHWMVEYMLDTGKTLPYGFKYSVHSQNPVGANNIKGLMNSIIVNFKHDDEKAVDAVKVVGRLL